MATSYESLFIHWESLNRPYGTRCGDTNDPGTEVPGYFPGVPTGRKMVKRKIHHCIFGTGHLGTI